MSNSPYKMFETDGDLEKKGVKIEYDDFWFMVARAGGKNEGFTNTLRTRLARVQSGGARSLAQDKIADKAARNTFIEQCLRGWGSSEFGDGKIPGRDGKPLEFNAENADKLFADLPDLLNDLVATVSTGAAFRKDLGDQDSAD